MSYERGSVMNTLVEAGRKYNRLKDPELESCTTEKQLEKYLKRNKHLTAEDQATFLIGYMCVRSIGGFGQTPYEELTEEDKRENLRIQSKELKTMFIDGAWRQMTDKYIYINARKS